MRPSGRPRVRDAPCCAVGRCLGRTGAPSLSPPPPTANKRRRARGQARRATPGSAALRFVAPKEPTSAAGSTADCWLWLVAGRRWLVTAAPFTVSRRGLNGREAGGGTITKGPMGRWDRKQLGTCVLHPSHMPSVALRRRLWFINSRLRDEELPGCVSCEYFLLFLRGPVAHQRYGLPVRPTYTRFKDARSKSARLATAVMAMVRPLTYETGLAVYG